jgi:uncharacterized protein (DUF2252 family)
VTAHLHLVAKPGHGGPGAPPRASRRALVDAGRALRDRVSRRSHADWMPPPHRRDPVEVLLGATQGSIPRLLPIRWGRMRESPFAYFRGAAAVMAADLARTPATGVRVQACGDCHLLNFGGFATPERRLVFDIDDFDETLPAPWEWDVKRLATSVVLAARANGVGKGAARAAARAAVRAYRRWTAEYAAMPVLEAWYASLDARRIVGEIGDPTLLDFRRRRVRKGLHTAVDIDHPKLVGGRRGPRIEDHPPLIYHLKGAHGPRFRDDVRHLLERYRASLPDDRRVLFDRYELVDHAMKVVGIGSVGRFCAIALFTAGGEDPLFLQFKEARTSVLAPYAGRSAFAEPGRCVVVGQRIMQAASDVFLGWSTGEGGRHFYVRRLHDVKLRPAIDAFDADRLARYAKSCGRALARAHARSGRAAMVGGYLGRSPRFDDAIAAFAVAYADQTERDHRRFRAAVRTGRLHAVSER